VIEDGDISAGHVGDVDILVVLDQADQRAAHADHIVIRMGAKAEHRLDRIAAGRVVLDRFHHPAENPLGDLVGTALVAQQGVEIVFAEILVIQLQQRLAGFVAQPQHRPLDQRIVPDDRPEEPWSGGPGKFRRRGAIDQHLGIAMVLERRGRHPLTGRLFQRIANDVCLVFSER